MTRKNTLLILAGLALLATTGVAQAQAPDNRQVWRNSTGEIVHNTWGNCVRSRWQIDHDPCGEPMPAAVVIEAQPPRTVIAREDRTVYFDFDHAELTPDAKARLDLLADRIASASDVQGTQVVGYADRIGTVSYNQKLSEKRALHVRDYLVSQGVTTASKTQTRWVGESEPRAQCPGKMPRAELIQCLQPDRKVEVELVYKKQTQPPQTRVNMPPDAQGQTY